MAHPVSPRIFRPTHPRAAGLTFISFQGMGASISRAEPRVRKAPIPVAPRFGTVSDGFSNPWDRGPNGGYGKEVVAVHWIFSRGLGFRRPGFADFSCKLACFAPFEGHGCT